jgi:hypothetical protein
MSLQTEYSAGEEQGKPASMQSTPQLSMSAASLIFCPGEKAKPAV